MKRFFFWVMDNLMPILGHVLIWSFLLLLVLVNVAVIIRYYVGAGK